MRKSGFLLAALALLLSGCDAGGDGSRPGEEGAPPPQLSVSAFTQAGGQDVKRDEVLELRLSEPVDPDSMRSGTVLVRGKEDGREQPVRVEADGATIRIHPPTPFGWEPEARYQVTVEGFPSLRAPRTPDGRLLSRPYRGSFATSRSYGPDLSPPVVESLQVEETEPGLWSVLVRFSETVDPRTVRIDESLTVRSPADGARVAGRLIHDRRVKDFRFLPDAPPAAREVRVVVTTGVTDLAGNPLQLMGQEDRTFTLSAVPEETLGEITEDFTSDEMMDPTGTTALWNDPRAPGVLLGDPARTTLLLDGGDPAAAELPFSIGAEPVVIRILLRREELGPARPLTALLWAPYGGDLVQAEYEGITVRITPTLRESLDDPGFDFEPQTVLSRDRYRVEADTRELAPLPFTRTFDYDGSADLLLEIRIGRGTHTNLMRAVESDFSVAWSEQGRKAVPLRPLLALRSFTTEPTATSRFYDSGSPGPKYLDPVLQPRTLPYDAELELEFQGARELDASGRPRRTTVGDLSPWVRNVRLLAGYRYLRFRATFRGMSLSGEELAIDDLRIPFLR